MRRRRTHAGDWWTDGPTCSFCSCVVSWWRALGVVCWGGRPGFSRPVRGGGGAGQWHQAAGGQPAQGCPSCHAEYVWLCALGCLFRLSSLVLYARCLFLFPGVSRGSVESVWQGALLVGAPSRPVPSPSGHFGRYSLLTFLCRLWFLFSGSPCDGGPSHAHNWSCMCPHSTFGRCEHAGDYRAPAARVIECR